MIVGSLLLILVAVGLLVGGVLSGSNTLIICCMVLVVAAAIVLVIGVKQQASANEESYADEMDDDEPTGDYPPASGSSYASRSRSAGRSADDDVTDESTPVRTRRGVVVPEESAAGAAYTLTATTQSIPVQSGYDDPYEAVPAYGGGAPSGYDGDTFGGQPDHPASNGAGQPGGYPQQEYATADNPDDDPPDEPSAQMTSPAAAARVAQLATEVLVIDGRPRYHVPGCVHLLGRQSEPLPVGEAVELGFTPCGLCEPDSALLAEARRV